MSILMKFAPLILPILLAACADTGTPAVQPPASSAQVDVKGMSLAAQRFNQFCIASIGGARDGVDLANAFYKPANPLPSLGTLKIGGDFAGEDIGVQYDTRRKGCMVTSSAGKAPNGMAELRALANAYAARNDGTVAENGRSGFNVTTSSGRSRFWFANAASGLSFLVES